MRRIVRPGVFGPVLIALGAFLIVAGVLVRVYAYPALARVPANYESMTYLEAKGATIFDTSTLEPKTTDLAIESHTVAGNYPDAPSDTVVWANNTTVRQSDGSIFLQSSELSPFDAVTGAATNYKVGFSSETQGERTSVVRTGQVYKFPFNTQKHDYLQWDGSIGKATTAKYSGTATVDGVKTYKFVQTIPATQIDTIEVPGSVFGLKAPSVEATMMYAMTRTLYIDPVTGSPVNRVEDRNQYFTYDGVDVPAFVGTVQYAQRSIDDVADQVKSKAPVLEAMRWKLPVGFGVIGLLMMAGGSVLSRRSRHRQHDIEDTRVLSEV